MSLDRNDCNDFDKKIYSADRESFMADYSRFKSDSVRRLVDVVSDSHGFTLVELIVVLVIIAVLAAAVGPGLLGYIDKTRENAVLNDAKKIYLAVQSISEQAHADLVDPSLRVTNSRITEITDITFTEGHSPYTVRYEINSFDINNPRNDMYIISYFTYTDGIYDVIYDRHKKSSDGDIWTVVKK